MATKIVKAPAVAKSTKTVKSRKQSVTVMDNGVVILPELRADDPGWGAEPLVLTQPQTDSERTRLLVRSLGWYSSNFGRKSAKEWMLHYATERGVSATDLKVLRSVHERQYDLQLGAVARLAGRGLVLTESELARIGDHLKSLMIAKTETVEVVATEADAKAPKPNVQEIMRDRARECAGELEGMFDEFVTHGAPDAASINVVGLLTERGIMVQHVGLIQDVWTKRKAEYEAVQAGTDKQLVEGYSQYTKVGFRGLVKWCDAVLAGLASYSTVKKASKAPRKRKPVPVEKQVAKVKYLKAFKDDALKVEITSVHPAKLVGATEAFLYDTQKRKVVYITADSHAGALSIKGTTVLGFDSKQSGIKTVRKPAELLKKLPGAGKPASRKLFSELTTAHAQWNGRLNENVIIVKAW